MKTQWIMHKGKKVLLCDYSGFGFDSAAAHVEMEMAIKLASQEPANSVLTLTDVRNTKVVPETYDQMRVTATKIGPYARRRAVVGIAGAQKLMLDMINKLPGQSGAKSLHVFDSLEAAKDWLVSD